jgi:hypothetical protein
MMDISLARHSRIRMSNLQRVPKVTSLVAHGRYTQHSRIRVNLAHVNDVNRRILLCHAK